MQADLSRVGVSELDALWSELLRRQENAGETWGFYERQLQEGNSVSLACLDRAQSGLCLAKAEEKPFRQEWERRGGWLRVFSDSYQILHRSLDCARTQPHQHPQLLPALSGWDDLQVIQHAGLSVCLTCFPGANRHPAYRRELQARRRAERCPGSTRKPAPGNKPLCSVCGREAALTPAGRVRTHKQPSSG